MNKQRTFRNFCILMLIPIVGFAIPLGASAQYAPSVDIQQLRQWLGHPDVIIVDVRLQKHYQMTGTKIIGAYREQPALVERWVEKYPRNKTIVFY